MSAPRGKGIYARQPSFYPDGDPAGYAAAMGCDFIALHDAGSSDDHIRRAQDLGLPVLLWQGPDSWLPNNWQRTLYGHAERVERMGLDGFIADVERANVWRNHDREVYELAGTLASAGASYRSVGFTSFPSWPWMRELAEVVVPYGVWGSPQLYGVLEPGTPAELLRRGERWHEAFGQVTPSLAAWDRTPEEQAVYLDAFRGERGAILWQSPTNAGQIKPWPGTAGFAVLRDWNVYRPARGFFSLVGERIMHPTRIRRDV
jgi:hypothetical protein